MRHIRSKLSVEGYPIPPQLTLLRPPEATCMQHSLACMAPPTLNPKRAHGGSGPDTGIWLNNPDAVPPEHKNKNLAPDIEFFFDRTGARAVCKEYK